MQVLIVEDDPEDVTLIRWHIPPTAKVDVAPKLVDAFGFLSEKDYDVILCDLNLPDSSPENTISLMSSVSGEVLFMSGNEPRQSLHSRFILKGDYARIGSELKSISLQAGFKRSLDRVNLRIRNVEGIAMESREHVKRIGSRVDMIDLHIEKLGELVKMIHESVKDAVVSKRLILGTVITAIIGLISAIITAVLAG